MTVVVKLGGEILTVPDRLAGILADLVELQRRGMRVVLVHGGGPQADALARTLGHEPRKVNGRRITTETDLEVAKMLYGGSLNLDIIGALARLGASGIRVSGLDGGLLVAARRPPVPVPHPEGGAALELDFGLVGDIVRVDPRILRLLLAHGYLPVVSPLAGDGRGAIFNVNADTVAGEVAKALGASRLVLLTNVPGILDAGGNVVPLLDLAAGERLAASGAVRAGMLPKLRGALDAVRGGVGSVHILDGTAPRPGLLEVFAGGRTGTTVRGVPGGNGIWTASCGAPGRDGAAAVRGATGADGAGTVACDAPGALAHG